jgi:hypothetical protein
MEPASATEGGQIGHSPSYGKYLVVRELGSGGMAQVFEGRHPELGSPVALKVLRSTIAAQSLAAARFSREARVAALIRHPNVVRVFDVGVQDGIPYIVMEFLEGENLQKSLWNKGPLALGSLMELFLPIVSGVETAHMAGIVHRDLKPANVMLTNRPPHTVHPIVLDFGISKTMGEDVDGMLTRSESLLGTVQYLAPELTRSAKFATAHSDQYALGVMLYECATGRRPFSGASYYELMHAIVTAPVTPPSHVVPSIAPEFDAIVLRAMAREPSQRFASVHDLGCALLGLGDRTMAHLWEQTFTNTATSYDLWSQEARGRSGGTRSSSAGQAGRKLRYGSLWGGLAVGVFVGGMIGTLVSVRMLPRKMGSSPPSSQGANSVPPAVATSRIESAPMIPAHSTKLGAEPAEIAQVEDHGEEWSSSLRASAFAKGGTSTDELLKSSPAVCVSTPKSRDHPNADSASTKFLPSVRAGVSAKTPDVGNRDTQRNARPQLGTNGAPIID